MTLFQLSSSSFHSGFEDSHKSHVEIKCKELNCELPGSSSYTPVTFTSIVLSMRIDLFIGSTSPNKAFAVDSESTMEAGSSKLLQDPFSILMENISSAPTSMKVPLREIVLSLTESACMSSHHLLTTCLKSPLYE